MRRVACWFAGAMLLLVITVPPVLGQQHSLDSLLSAHRVALRLGDGRLGGPGADLILAAASEAQFVGILEEHNLLELAELSTALFDTLQRAYGFRHAALEQGGVITDWLVSAARARGMDSVATLVARWPHAPTFATDEELAMIAHIAMASPAPYAPVWGIDQELGALHILERLVELAPDAAAGARARELAATARRYEADRAGDTLYLAQVATPDDFATLAALYRPIPGSDVARLVDALQFSNRVYYHNTLARQGAPTMYESMREREQGMKQQFMRQYRLAIAAGDTLPRVLLKLGHWHLYRGIYRADVPTFGNFASELATANGMQTFYLHTAVIDSPEPWRNSAAFAELALPGEQFTVIDFRPLRPYAHQGSIEDLGDRWRALLFQADGALIVRGGRTGSYTLTRGQ